MAEFCKDCFINHLMPSVEEIKRIVLSDDPDFCEGCGEIKNIVLYLKSKTESC